MLGTVACCRSGHMHDAQRPGELLRRSPCCPGMMCMLRMPCMPPMHGLSSAQLRLRLGARFIGATACRPLPHLLCALRRLPVRIKPAIFAFGTLADGFLPFDLQLAQQAQQGDGGGEQAQQAQQAQQAHDDCGGAVNGDSGAAGSAQHAQHGGGQCDIRLCSVVMKAVQVRAGRLVLRGQETGVRTRCKVERGGAREWHASKLRGKL